MLLFLEMVFTHSFLCMFYLYEGFCTYANTYLPSPTMIIYEEHLVVMQEEIEEPMDCYEASVLSDEQQTFFNNFTESLHGSPIEESENEVEELLTMDTWTSQPVQVEEISTKLAASASAKISDYKLGEQLWVVEVVGEEEGYLHVSDGSARAWIDSNLFGRFGRKDVLSVLVDRQTDQRVLLLQAEMLQAYSPDFGMVDEFEYMEHTHEFVVISA